MIERVLKKRTNKTAAVYRKRTKRDTTTGDHTIIYSEKKGAVRGFFYFASATARSRNDQYRSEIEAFFLIPHNAEFKIETTDKIVIDGHEYSALYIDDIAGQGKVDQISMKRF